MSGFEINAPSIKFGNAYTLATMPLASTCPGEIFWCSDWPAGSSLITSDGTKFRALEDMAVGLGISTVITLDSSGNGTWTFPTSTFAAVPVITHLEENASANQPVVVSITAISKDAVSINAKRAQVIPQNLVSVLLGQTFNVFGGAAPSGVKVHLIAMAKTS